MFGEISGDFGQAVRNSSNSLKETTETSSIDAPNVEVNLKSSTVEVNLTNANNTSEMLGTSNNSQLGPLLSEINGKNNGGCHFQT